MTEIKDKATPLRMLVLGPAIMLITLLAPSPFEGMSADSMAHPRLSIVDGHYGGYLKQLRFQSPPFYP